MLFINSKPLNQLNESFPVQLEDILSIQGIETFLSENTPLDKIFLFSSLKSTNNTAKDMIRTKIPHGTVIIADSQTKGRGRYNRSFFSPSGHGIYMSIVLELNKSNLANHLHLVTLATAVATCEGIERATVKKPRIKWVNDIFLNQKKISGILTEKVMDGENTPWIIIGIGINFSTPADTFPMEIKDTAGSIFPNKPPTTTRNQLIAEILNQLLSPQHFNTQKILSEYKKRLMFIGEETLITGFGPPFKGKIVDIDEAGSLIVRKENDQQIHLSVGEISLL